MRIIIETTLRDNVKPISQAVINKLEQQGIDVPVVEIDDTADNLFATVRPDESLMGIYVSIDEDENGFFNIWLNERGHSGGDPTLDVFSFHPKEQDSQIDRICQLYLQARG